MLPLVILPTNQSLCLSPFPNNFSSHLALKNVETETRHLLQNGRTSATHSFSALLVSLVEVTGGTQSARIVSSRCVQSSINSAQSR